MKQAEYDRLSRAVFKYNANPNKFTDNEAESIAKVAQMLGLPFKPESKALQKFFFDLADTALLGLLPEDQRPKSRGEDIFGETRGERASSLIANIVGLLSPGAAGVTIGGKIAPKLVEAASKSNLGLAKQFSRTMKGLKKDDLGNFIVDEAAKKRGLQLQSAFQLGTEGAVVAGLTNILEDPLGTPGRAITGAALGGTLGAIAPSLRNPLAIPGYRAINSMSQGRGAYATTARMASDQDMLSRLAQGSMGGGVKNPMPQGVVTPPSVPRLAAQTPSTIAQQRAGSFLVRSTSGTQQTVRPVDNTTFKNLFNQGRIVGPDNQNIYTFIGDAVSPAQTNLLRLTGNQIGIL
tara:strand:+ start:864 stop:1910 length:1047 start_codon:yes stop_codon:yes gene_type:complete